jgi:hypothetical protein
MGEDDSITLSISSSQVKPVAGSGSIIRIVIKTMMTLYIAGSGKIIQHGAQPAFNLAACTHGRVSMQGRIIVCYVAWAECLSFSEYSSKMAQYVFIKVLEDIGRRMSRDHLNFSTAAVYTLQVMNAASIVSAYSGPPIDDEISALRAEVKSLKAALGQKRKIDTTSDSQDDKAFWRFNSKMGCSVADCKFSHVCSKCKRPGHVKTNCRCK